ncbi:MAG: hypothetical protein ACM3ML_28960 [Micromonosporaceae bacterium]
MGKTRRPRSRFFHARFHTTFHAPAEAAGEWRFIVGWCEERGYTIAAGWPKRELARIDEALAAG